MKHALSARYGGLLVDPEECDYTSFKHLHLLCPNCKKSVYLVSAKSVEPHTRKIKRDGAEKTVQVKGCSVDAYFAHHPDVSASAVEACELRVRSMSDTERLAIQARSRKQLLRVLHSHFWKILSGSYCLFSQEYMISYVREAWLNIPKKSKKTLEALYSNLLDTLYVSVSEPYKKAQKEDYLLMHGKMVEAVKSGLDAPTQMEDAGGLFTIRNQKDDYDFFNCWASELDTRLHASIVAEMMYFACQPRQRGIFNNLIEIALHEYAFWEGRNAAILAKSSQPINGYGDAVFVAQLNKVCTMDQKQFQKFVYCISASIYKYFAMVDWAGQYEKYHNEDLAKGVSVA